MDRKVILQIVVCLLVIGLVSPLFADSSRHWIDVDEGGRIPPSGSKGKASFTFSVEGLEGAIKDVDIILSIVHGFTADLDVKLLSPEGTKVVLFHDIGGNKNHFKDTRLKDEANKPIRKAKAPFKGNSRPFGSLSDFDGEAPNGI